MCQLLRRAEGTLETELTGFENVVRKCTRGSRTRKATVFWAIWSYPARWRVRYRGELDALIEDSMAPGGPTELSVSSGYTGRSTSLSITLCSQVGRVCGRLILLERS